MVAVLGLALFAFLFLLGKASALARVDRVRVALKSPGDGAGGWASPGGVGAPSGDRAALRVPMISVAAGVLGGVVGSRVLGPVGVAFGASAAFLPLVLERRKRRRKLEVLEVQLIDLVEAVGQCVRSGLSLTQALAFAEQELHDPMSGVLHRVLAANRVGTPLDQALWSLGEDIGSEDARMFALVLGIHLRSGGDVGEALDQLAATIRRRVAVRRELRALTAQGRISGTVLVALPVGFLLFLSVTSNRELLPVYRSAAGMTMLGAGLLLDLFALLWIRRLLRVDL